MDIIMGKERRRWSEDDKRRIVLETFEAGVTCHEIARRHQLSNGMLFTWRKRLRGELGFPEAAPPAVRFAPLAMIGASEPVATPAPSPTIEVDIGGAARVWITGDARADLVAVVLKALPRR